MTITKGSRDAQRVFYSHQPHPFELFLISLFITDEVARLAREEEALGMQLNGFQEKIKACYAAMDELRCDRMKRIDKLKGKAQELEQQQVRCHAEISRASLQKTSLEGRLEELAKEKSHIEFSVNFLTQRDPLLPEVEIAEDIQLAITRFQAQLTKIDHEFSTVQQHSDELDESKKRERSQIACNKFELKNIRLELDMIVGSSNCSSYSVQMKELVEKKKALTDSCHSLEGQLSGVIRKSRFLRLDASKNCY